jgi:hypothetical protein
MVAASDQVGGCVGWGREGGGDWLGTIYVTRCRVVHGPSTDLPRAEMTIKSRRACCAAWMGAKNSGILAAAPVLSRGRTVASRARSSGRPFGARVESLNGSCQNAGLACIQVHLRSPSLPLKGRADWVRCAWP